MNFTRTAAYLVFAGALLFCDTIFDEKPPKKSIIPIVSAVIMTSLGIMIRKSGAFLASGFICLIFACKYFSERDFSRKTFVKYCKHGAKILIFLSLIPALSILNGSMKTTAEKDFEKYNSARSVINDYSKNLLPYKQNKEFYSEHGVSTGDDLLAFRKWIQEDTNCFTDENIIAIAQKAKKFVNVSNLSEARRIIIEELKKIPESLYCLTLLPLFLFLIFDRKNRFNIIFIYLFAFMFFSALVIKGRMVSRVSESIMAMAALSALYMINTDNLDIKKNGLIERCRKSRIFPIILCVLMLSYTVVFAKLCIAHHNYLIIVKNRIAENRADVDHMDKSDNYFILHSRGPMPSNSFLPLETIPEHYGDNLFLIGGCVARTPENVIRREKAGIINPAQDIFEREDILSLFDEALYTYLKRNYNEDITVSLLNEHFVAKYTAPKIETTRQIDAEYEYELKEEQKFEHSGCKYLLSEFSGRLYDANYDILYLNAYKTDENGKRVVSYMISCDESGKLFAYLHDIKDVDFEDAYLVGKDKNGEYVKIVNAR